MGCVSTPLWVIFQICVPSALLWIGVTLRLLGSPELSRTSVAGFTYGNRTTFCNNGVAPCASTPMEAIDRPYGSKLTAFCSSCSALGCNGMESWLPDRVSNLKLCPPCWSIRANPSHFALALTGALQSPVPTKLVPYAEL